MCHNVFVTPSIRILKVELMATLESEDGGSNGGHAALWKTSSRYLFTDVYPLNAGRYVILYITGTQFPIPPLVAIYPTKAIRKY